MKKILLIALLALSANLNAQWKSQDIVDEFGDVTETVESYTTTGLFSNSATRNSNLKIIVSEFKDLYRIGLYEYGGGSPESLAYRWEEHVINVKLEDGTLMSGTVSYVPDGQGIYIYKKNKLGKLITTYKGFIKFGIVDGSTNYRFKILGKG